LLRPQPSREIQPGSVLDPNEVAEVEALVEFVGICRYFAGELAINEMTQRALSELRQYLDDGTRALLEGLRHAGESDRSFRQSQVDAAVRFCAKVFGREYAALLGKAAEVAGGGESRAARA
jgi:DNA-binding GntR family transcriptional regulator